MPDTGGNGVQLGAINDLPPADRTSENAIANNYIHHCGQLEHGAVGIWVGNR